MLLADSQHGQYVGFAPTAARYGACPVPLCASRCGLVIKTSRPLYSTLWFSRLRVIRGAANAIDQSIVSGFTAGDILIPGCNPVPPGFIVNRVNIVLNP